MMIATHRARLPWGGRSTSRVLLTSVVGIAAIGIVTGILLAFHIGVAAAAPSVTCSTTTVNPGGVDITISSDTTSADPVVISASAGDYDVTVAGGSVNPDCSGLSTSTFPDAFLLTTGTPIPSEFIEIDNSNGAFASSSTGCVVDFEVELTALTSGSDELAIRDDATSPGAGDDTVGVASAVSTDGTTEGVTLSEGACTAADVTVPAGYAVVGLDVQGQATTNELDLSGVTSSSASQLVVNPGADTLAAPGSVTGMPGGVTVTFNGEQTVNGPAFSTDFQPGTAPDVVFVGTSGAGIANTLDLSGESAAAADLTVGMGADSAANPGTLTGTASDGSSLDDMFYGIATVLGSPNGTTFQPGAAGGVTFVGSFSVPDTVQLPATTGPLTVGVNSDDASTPAEVIGLAGGVDLFSGVTELIGNAGTGRTTFDASEVTNAGSAVDVTYVGGAGPNELNFGSLSSPGNALEIDVVAGTAQLAPAGGRIATFSNISQFVGCDSTGACSGTTFAAAPSVTDQFSGEGSSNTLDLSQLSGASVTLSPTLTAGTVTLTAAGTISFTGIEDFAGGGVEDSISLAAQPAGILFALSPVAAGMPGTPAVCAGGCELATMRTSDGDAFAYDFTTFVGSSSGSNTFQSDGYGGHTFEAGGSSNSLDLSGLSLAGLTVDAAGSCSPSPDCVTGLEESLIGSSSTTDYFGDVQTFDGSTGDTTFESSASGGLTFNGGTAPNDTVDLTTAPGGTQIQDSACSGTVISGSATESFSDVAQFVGSANGNTTFVASGSATLGDGNCGTPTSTTFRGQGTNNTLDLSSVPSGSGAAVDIAPSGAGTVSSGATPFETFAGVATVDGPDGGNTTVVTSETGGYTFNGEGIDNTLSFAGVTTSNGVQVFLDLTPQQADPGSGTDSFADFSTIVGSPNDDTFDAGPGNYSIDGGGTTTGGTDTLSYAAAPNGITMTVAGCTESSCGAGPTSIASGFTITGGFSGTTTASGVSTFVGSDQGDNNFVSDAYGGYSFDAPSGTSGNSLSFGDFEPTPPSGVTGVVLDVAGATGTGTACGLSGATTGAECGAPSNTSDSFENIQAFTGSPGPDTFEVGQGDFTLAGGGASSGTVDTLSFANATAAVSVDLAGSTQSAGGAGIADGITGFESIVGAPVGDNDFIAPSDGGYTFAGEGSGNELNLSSAPAGIVIGATTVSGLAENTNDGDSTTDTFSDIQTFTGASAGSSVFEIGCTAGQQFKGGPGSAITMNFSSCPPSKGPTVNASTSLGTISGLPGGTDTFTGVTTISGPSTGATTFIAPGSTGGFVFIGAGQGNTLDTSAFPAGAVIDDRSVSAGQATLTAGESDTFADMNCFVGSSLGSTTFDASAAPDSTAGCTESESEVNFQASGMGNVLDLGALSSSSVPLRVSAAAGTVAIGGDTFDSFGDIQGFVGSNFGNTTFLASGVAGGESFSGQGSGNTLSFASFPPSGPALTIDLIGGTVSSALTPDTFAGIQTMVGSPNADTFLAGPVTMALVGGGGSDTISFASATKPANVTLGQGSAAGSASGGFPAPAELTLSGIQNVVSSPEGGTVEGNLLPSTFAGGSGNDVFEVVGGADVIDGGGGSNTLDLALTKSLVTLDLELKTAQSTGGAGTLTIVPGTIETVIGSNFGNRLIAGGGTVTLRGGSGTDWLQAGSGTDTLIAGSGPATLVGGIGADTMTGGKGADTFIPGTGGGKIVDVLGAGTLDYSSATASVHVNVGPSSYTTPSGLKLPADEATGGGGKTESLEGLEGIIGSNHGDVLVGSAAKNRIEGGKGTNLIVGNGGGDTLIGGSGTNVFITGKGHNVVEGGKGANTIDYFTAPGAVNVDLAKGTASKNGWGGSDTLSGIENIIGSRHNGDVLQLGALPGEITAGGGKGDVLTGSKAGGSTLDGGAGGDTLRSLGPDDRMNGGAGDDTFLADNGFKDFMNGGGGYNTAYVDCIDVKDKTFTKIQKVHAPSTCPSSLATPPARAAPATRAVSVESSLGCPTRELVPGRQLQLPQNSRDVTLHGLHRDRQLLRDLLVGVPPCDEPENLALARG